VAVLLVACSRPRPFFIATYGDGYPGTAYRAEPEHVAIAAADGHVVQATRTRSDLCVVLVHTGSPEMPQFFTLYCNLRSVAVARPGRAVVRGEVIGMVDGDRPWVRFLLCTYLCTMVTWSRHSTMPLNQIAAAPEDLEGTLDPERHMAGCYEPGRRYDPATLTRPVLCRDGSLDP